MIKQVKKLENGITYYYHENLICKAPLKLQNAKLHPNYIYKIVGMNNKDFELLDEDTSKTFKVSHQTIVKCFSLPYCNTCHSSQGDKIEQKYVISDWKSSLIDMKWLYTAITRATKLDNIYFLDEDLTELNVDTICEAMIAGYIYQDKKAKRDMSTNNYITTEWIKEKYKECHGTCSVCKNHMSYEKSSVYKTTVDRINNDICHTKSNCHLMCKHCNCSKSNR
jgi:hypothetical protein